MSKQTDTHSDFSATAELLANETYLKNYNADIIKKISSGFMQTLGKDNYSSATVLEFGAGTGALAAEYYFQNQVKPDCIEIDKNQIQIIKNKGFTCFSQIEELQKKYDAIYTSNVLEHIEDDVQTLKTLHSHLKVGGSIAIYVPAFMCIWTKMDEMVGHYRRYSRKELCQKVSAAGFKITSCHYADSVGFFAWLYLRFSGYKGGASETPTKSLKFFDKYLYPISQFLDWLGCRYFFGKNVLLMAEKTQ